LTKSYKYTTLTQFIQNLKSSFQGGKIMRKGLNWVYSIERTILSEKDIQARVQAIAQQIDLDYQDEEYPIILICILKGAFVFCADLIRCLNIPFEVHFMDVSSYNDGTQSSGVVKIEKDISVNITDRRVIIIEDIVDTGLTLAYLKEFLDGRHPRSLAICTLLDKPEARQAEVQVDYSGFQIGNEFVVGYGLDFAQQLRGLPGISILKPEVYQEDEE